MDKRKQEISVAVGTRIRYLRLIRSLSQEEVALRANLNPAYYGQVERGAKCPTVDTLYKISTALEVPLPELVRLDSIAEYPWEQDHHMSELLAQVPKEKVPQVLKVIESIVHLI